MSVSQESYLIQNASELGTEGLENRVFLGWSGVLNSLNNGRETGSGAERPDMVDGSPFPEDSRELGHQIVVDDTFDVEAAEEHLEGGLEDSDIDYESGGEFYQVKLDEIFEPGSETPGRHLNDIGMFENTGLNNSDIDMEMLNVHIICYESPDGQQHMIHWDPAFYDEEGKKNKYISQDGELTTKSAPVTEDKEFFIDNSNYSLDEGLSQVANDLDSLGEKYFELTNELEDEEAYEAVWMGKRWKQMAEGLESYQEFLNENLGKEAYI